MLPTTHRGIGNIKVDTGRATYEMPVMAYIPQDEDNESYRVEDTYVILGPSFVFGAPEGEYGDKVIYHAIINGQVEICHPLTAELRAQMLGVTTEEYQEHEMACGYLEQAEISFSEMQRLHREAEREAAKNLHALAKSSPLAERLGSKRMGIVNVYVITKNSPFEDTDMSGEFLV